MRRNAFAYLPRTRFSNQGARSKATRRRHRGEHSQVRWRPEDNPPKAAAVFFGSVRRGVRRVYATLAGNKATKYAIAQRFVGREKIEQSSIPFVSCHDPLRLGDAA